MTKPIRKLGQDGLTLIELMITLVLTSAFVALIMFFTFHYWRYGYALNADLDTLVQRLNASDFLREYVGSSSGLINQNSLSDANTGVVDPVAGAGFWTTIHAIPGNKPMGASGTITPLFYFKKPSLSSTGNYIMNGTQPFEDEFVIYLDGTSKAIKMRRITNPGAADNKIKTSCPANLATAACPADNVIVDNVASVDMRYFSRTGNTIDYTSIVDSLTGEYIGPDFPSVEVVELTVNIAVKPVFQASNTTQTSTIIRVALRNR